MAKARDVKGLSRSTRVRRAARLVLTQRAADTWAHLEAARAGEQETGIHDMRVACKRLREAMRLFAPSYRKGPFRAALSRVDALNDLLGAVRDGDVLVERLRSLDGEVNGPARALLHDLCERLGTERRDNQTQLVAVLDDIATSGFPGELGVLIDEARHGPDHDVAGQTLKRFARLAISVRLSKVILRLEAITGEEDAAGLHRARVANKHLRYAIEPFLGIFDRRLAQAYHRVVEMHESIGDVHDLDVLRATVADYAVIVRGEDVLAPVVEQIGELRAREFGRVVTFCQPSGRRTYVQMVADALD